MKYLLTKLHFLLLASIVSLIAASSAFGTATIVILNNDKPGVGFNDPSPPVAGATGNNGATLGEQRMIALQAAANIWGATLVSGPTIYINASWPSGAADDPDLTNRALPCTQTTASLGSAGNSGNIWKDFSGSVPGFWYGNALANALTNSDLNGSGTPEINARFNVNLGTPGCFQSGPWYYGLDNNHGSNTDLMAVALHEFAHGLGFQTFTNSSTTGAQAFGTPTIYDRFLLDNTTGKTWPQMTDTERLASAINTNNLVWNGAQVTADAVILSSGKDVQGHPQMFAPNPVQSGSSVSHWDRFPIVPDQLMEPFISPSLSHSVTTPQDLTFSLMRDIGWCAGCPQPPPPSPTPTPSPPPNDNFVNAQVISGCSGSVTGTNVASTHESGEPTHVPGVGNRSVWYRWQAPSTSSATLTTAGSGFDTVLAVYTGNSVNGLTLVPNGSNDDIPDVPGQPHDTSSSVTINVTAGTTYQIAVDGFNNNGDGGGTGNLQLNWTASPCSAGGPTVQLSAPTYSFGEGAGSGTITVNLLNSSAAATVRYATSDTAGLQSCTVFNSKASERCDYETAAGTLRFAAGETSKTFIIPIVNDVHVDGNETLTVTLSAPTGATLGSPSSATVTITDNDAPGAANPLDGVDFFITMQYLDFLARLPDPDGLAGWKAVLDPCPNGGFGEFDNPNCDRVHVSQGFFQSDEFRGRGYWAYRFYEVAFNRRPTYAEFVPDMAQVGGPQTTQSEELSKSAYKDEFVLRPEFTGLYNGTSNAAFVSTLEANAEVDLDNAALEAQLAGGKSRAQLLREIVESLAVENKFSIRAYVAMQYFGYLRRDPDTDGYNGWVTALTNNPSDLRHMIFGFIYSNEYRSRFGP